MADAVAQVSPVWCKGDTARCSRVRGTRGTEAPAHVRPGDTLTHADDPQMNTLQIHASVTLGYSGPASAETGGGVGIRRIFAWEH